MSRERKFHNLIKNQNSEEKDRLWEKIEKELGNENITVVVPRKKKFPMGRFVAVVSSCVLIVTIATIAVWKFLPQETGPRYCTQDQYRGTKTDMTLKEYAKENNKELLYFDWYEKADLLENTIYQLNDTNEIICFQEDMINGETGTFISLYVVDTQTKMDMLDYFYTRCDKSSPSKGYTSKLDF